MPINQNENRSVESSSPLSDYEKNKVETACKLPNITPEQEKEIRDKLDGFENRINERFGNYISPKKLEVVDKIHLVGTQDFMSALGNDKIPVKYSTINLLGFRTNSGEDVFISTTNIGESRTRTLPETMLIAKHEMVHLKIDPVILEVDGDTCRITGCKEIVENADGSRYAYHSLPYEAMTEILSLYLATPKEILQGSQKHDFESIQMSYLILSTRGQGGYIKEVEALTNILKKAFDNFEEGIEFLGKNYFSCAGRDFFNGLTDKIVGRAKDRKEAFEAMKEYYEASAHNDSEKMREAGLKVNALEVL